MGRDKFRTVVKGLITCKGEILIGKKEESEEHPIGGEWHILGGHLEHGEQPEEAMKREAKEETGLDVDVHQIVDVMTWDSGESVKIIFHCEAKNKNAEAADDLQEVKWIKPENINEKIHEEGAKRLEERPEQAKFLKKIMKSPF